MRLCAQRRGRAVCTAEEPCVCRRFASDFLSFVLTRCSFVIAGLDPATCKTDARIALPPALRHVASAWTTGIGVRRTPFCKRLCPVVTISESGVQWPPIARVRSRIARTVCHCARRKGPRSNPGLFAMDEPGLVRYVLNQKLQTGFVRRARTFIERYFPALVGVLVRLGLISPRTNTPRTSVT